MFNKKTIKIEETELNILKTMIKKRKDHPSDIWAKESLNQYMEDLGNKYRMNMNDVNINLETGEIHRG